MQNKEMISAVALIVAAIALFLNMLVFRHQRRISQATLFHNITTEINDIFKQQKECEEKGEEAVKNWIERLVGALEYFAFFANHKYLTRDMKKYYLPTVVIYCDHIKEIPQLEEMFTESSEYGELFELRKYYKKYLKKPCPI